MRTRRRKPEIFLRNGEVIGRTYTYGSLTFTTTVSGDRYCKREKCIDELHAHWRTRNPSLPIGGPLDLQARTLTYRFPTVTAEYGPYKYVGRLISNFSVLDDNPFPNAAKETASYGPLAWNRFRPGRPAVDMGVFVGELRELPSMLRETCLRLRDIYRSLRRLGPNPMGLSLDRVRRDGSRQLAKDYLAYQFGWLPFVSDIIRCYEVSKDIDRRLREIRENNGKVRRRGGVVKNTTLVTSGNAVVADCIRPTLVTPLYIVEPTASFTRTESVKIWFKGAFRYWIPDVGSLRWKRRTKRLLYGLDLNAEVVWNLIPWSWLIDWFANIGDNISSMNNGWADNLTAKYAYVMGLHQYDVTYSGRAVLHGHGPVEVITRVVGHAKERVEASPYGFGVSFDSLSLKRLAILAALGVTRLKAEKLF